MKTQMLERLVGEFAFRCAKMALYLTMSLYAGWVSTPNFPFGFWQGLVVLLILAVLAPLFAVACCGAMANAGSH